MLENLLKDLDLSLNDNPSRRYHRMFFFHDECSCLKLKKHFQFYLIITINFDSLTFSYFLHIFIPCICMKKIKDI